MLVGELTDTSWGRRALHARAAAELPWPRLLELTDLLPEATLALLLTRADCDPRLPGRVLARFPRLLASSRSVATRPEHVLAALAELTPGNRFGRRNGELRELVLWGLPRLGVDPDAAADAAPTFAMFLDVLDDLGIEPVCTAWRESAVAAMARRLTGAAGDGQTESAWRLVHTVLGDGDAPVGHLVAAASAAGSPAGG